MPIFPAFDSDSGLRPPPKEIKDKWQTETYIFFLSHKTWVFHVALFISFMTLGKAINLSEPPLLLLGERGM